MKTTTTIIAIITIISVIGLDTVATIILQSAHANGAHHMEVSFDNCDSKDVTIPSFVFNAHAHCSK